MVSLNGFSLHVLCTIFINSSDKAAALLYQRHQNTVTFLLIESNHTSRNPLMSKVKENIACTRTALFGLEIKYAF